MKTDDRIAQLFAMISKLAMNQNLTSNALQQLYLKASGQNPEDELNEDKLMKKLRDLDAENLEISIKATVDSVDVRERAKV